MANYPQELAQDAVCQSHTGHTTGLWFLPTRPLRMNTYEWMNEWLLLDNYMFRPLLAIFRLSFLTFATSLAAVRNILLYRAKTTNYQHDIQNNGYELSIDWHLRSSYCPYLSSLHLISSLLCFTLCCCFQHVYSTSQPVHGTATYRYDDTRGCIIQFWPPDDEHICSKHVEAWNKVIVKQILSIKLVNY